MTPAVLRRAIHAASGAVFLLILAAPPVAYRTVMVAAAGVVLALDLARIRHRALHDVACRALPVFRQSERRRLSGAFWLLLGYAIAAFLPARAATAGILVGALADPAAAVVGERLGGGRSKSWPGTLAALVTGYAALAVAGLPMDVAAVAGAVGAAVERWPGAVDDNLLIAPAVGVTVALLA